jgi:hypothetical protein
VELPDGGVENVGIGGVDDEVAGTGDVGLEEDFGPGLATVFGAKDTALGVGAGHVADGRDVDQVGIFGIDADAADLLRGFEADVRPGLAGVGGLVHAVAVGGVAAHGGFAGADVQDVGVRRRNRDGADRPEIDLAVGDGLPGVATVGGLEDASAHTTEVEDERLVAHTGDGDDAAAAEWAELAEGNPLQRIGRGRGLGKGSRSEQNEAERSAAKCGEAGRGEVRAGCGAVEA